MPKCQWKEMYSLLDNREEIVAMYSIFVTVVQMTWSRYCLCNLQEVEQNLLMNLCAIVKDGAILIDIFKSLQ